MRVFVFSLVLSLPTFAQAETLYSSGTWQSSSPTGYLIDQDNWWGAKFSLSQTAHITTLGAHIGGSGKLFIAVFEVAAATGLPPSPPSLDDAVFKHSFTLPPSASSDLVSSTTDFVLGPGDYAMVYGADPAISDPGSAHLPETNTPNGSPVFVQRAQSAVWASDTQKTFLFFVQGYRLASACGNGFAETGEECDGNGEGVGGETQECDLDCSFRTCGDETINEAAGEECDDGLANGSYDGCATDCTGPEPRCGNGIIEIENHEICDDGNASSRDACPSNCQPSSCGDGFVNTEREQCDDGNLIDGDACSNACKNATPSVREGPSASQSSGCAMSSTPSVPVPVWLAMSVMLIVTRGLGLPIASTKQQKERRV